MVKRETFVNVLNEMMALEDAILALNNSEILDNVFEDSLIFPKTHANSLAMILDEAFDTDLVSYWVWELNFGRQYKDGLYVVDNNVVDISTPDKLYDHLVNKNEE